MSDSELTPGSLAPALQALMPAPHWYVGFSGGLDSTVLLHLLTRYGQDLPATPPLSAIHINHGLQQQSDDWQRHCERVCADLGVPLVSLKAEITAGSSGLEAAARDARYRLFTSQLQNGEVLLLAHHADDQVETFFLRLMRGAGVQGLAAIAESRELGCGRLVRPLLQLSRAQLEHYAVSQGLTWVDDPSNSDTRFDRNFMRNRVLPLLAERWPGYRQTIQRASEHMKVASEHSATMVAPVRTTLSAMGDPGLPLAMLQGDITLAALRLRQWLSDRGLPAPDRAPLEEFLRQLSASKEGARSRLATSQYVLQRYKQGIYLLPSIEWATQPEPIALRQGEVVDLPSGLGRFRLVPTAGAGIRLQPEDVLTLRWRRGGERGQPVGRSERTSLKKLLQEREIPPWWRERLPLLCLGDELLAVADLWLCHSSRLAASDEQGSVRYKPIWERAQNAAGD
ncbi:MAG: tRNA lysidine(34) synthetase TilS [Pseudomonadota bacterium]